MAANIAANGTAWRVQPIDRESAKRDHVPPLPGAGLLFTSADAAVRFLSLTFDAVPRDEYRRDKTLGELATMVKSSRPLDR